MSNNSTALSGTTLAPAAMSVAAPAGALTSASEVLADDAKRRMFVAKAKDTPVRFAFGRSCFQNRDMVRQHVPWINRHQPADLVHAGPTHGNTVVDVTCFHK